VRVPILGTDAGMHHERPLQGNGEDALLEQSLATCEHQVGSQTPNELLGLGRIRASSAQHWNRPQCRIRLAEHQQFLLYPAPISTCKKQRVVDAESNDI